MKNGEPKPFLM